MARNYNKWRKEHRRKRKQWAINYLGGQCNKCGSTDNLEFDHINRSDKNFSITHSDLSRTKLIAELNKCQLLCHSCHLKKTISEIPPAPKVHGTMTMYNNGHCHCLSCKDAWAKYIQNRRLKRQLI